VFCDHVRFAQNGTSNRTSVQGAVGASRRFCLSIQAAVWRSRRGLPLFEVQLLARLTQAS
jgi:hypothetical protein